ncbi:hypothetical protein HOK51_08245 [Candidatus Woesearchaeota archaeon]|mgnify:FL=1|jgi:hypothetical protein|nr:hypothetical protein [Candidatus Woesearchaeota archaeon]MBT6519815.1 hypothetical protein [Candidatus Woesearchaeota archaeon]MBT7368194.1 hypothetical protein [Candidatus Woesearchaeota archaeon]
MKMFNSRIEIPRISDQKLNRLYKKIKPVVRFIELRYRNKVEFEADPRGDLYTVKQINPRICGFTSESEADSKISKLKLVAEIQTYHNADECTFFRPSVAEVLAQIPAQFIGDVVAFETLTDSFELDGDNYRTKTILYGKN